MTPPRTDLVRATRSREAAGRALLAILAAAALAGCSDTTLPPQDLRCTGGPDGSPPDPLYLVLMDDVLTNADYWEPEPRILAAGLGFTDIIGVPGLDDDDLDVQRQSTIDAGGAWELLQTTATSIPQRAYTSAVSPSGVENTFG
jgi:hypothetical protein